MELRVLGPVEAFVDGSAIDLGAPRQRCVLAVLALEPNRIVPLERLIDAIWDTDAPPAAKSSVQAYISRLRKAFTSVDGLSLTGRAGGYRLDIAPEAIDLHRFQTLTKEARQTPDPVTADRLFSQALDLWRGDPLSDVRTSWLTDRVCAGLEQQRLDAIEDRYDCRLKLGAHADVISPLRGLVAEHPLRERLVGLLILALYRSGQKAAALETYQQAADRIVEDLGLDPGTELRKLHEAILRDEPWLDAPPPPKPEPVRAVAVERPRSVTPAQLPGDIAAFTGRRAELERLDALHHPGDDMNRSAGMRITAITGTAGVGKTSLALHWGHRAAAQFPDGALYLNLRGFDDQQPPIEPTDALRQLLGGLGTSINTIPASLDERAALFRSLLANRNALIVLDNARGSKQVRPLLPGTPECHVLVTSRTRLDGLVALDGAHQISLDSLSPDESRQLLATIIGSARVDAEPEAVQQLSALCGHLPLGLRLAGAQLAAQESRAITDFVDELADYQDRLDTLDLLDLDTPLRATFDVSYESLTDDAAAVFRIVGLHPGPDVDPLVLAAGITAKVSRVRRWLDQLAIAHLVSESTPGRYTMHDLLRAYALEKANELPLHEQDVSTERMLDYYLHVARQAKSWQYAGQNRYTGGVNHVPAEVPAYTSVSEASAWFETERINLIAAIRHAAGRQDPRHSYLLPGEMALHFELSHRWEDGLVVGEIGLRAARKGTDYLQELRMLNLLGSAAANQGSPDDSAAYFRQLHQLAVANDDNYAAGLSLSNLSLLMSQCGRYDEAADTAEQALTFISRETDPWNWANTRNSLSEFYRRTGDATAAVKSGMEALAVFTELGDEAKQSRAIHSLGEAYLAAGQYSDASDYLRRAIELGKRSGNDRTITLAFIGLGDIEKALGNTTTALRHWQEALSRRDKLQPDELDQLARRIEQAGCGPELSPA